MFHSKEHTMINIWRYLSQIYHKTSRGIQSNIDIFFLWSTRWEWALSVCLWTVRDAEKMNNGVSNIKDEGVAQQLFLFIFHWKHLDTSIHLLICPLLPPFLLHSSVKCHLCTFNSLSLCNFFWLSFIYSLKLLLNFLTLHSSLFQFA